MNKHPKKTKLLFLGLGMALLLMSLSLADPAQADGGGWPTDTPTNTLTATSPLNLLFTPEPGTQPAVINPDTGSPAISFEDELATIQVQVDMTAAAQSFALTPTPVVPAESKGMSPLLMVGGLLGSIVLLAFLAFRFLRR